MERRDLSRDSKKRRKSDFYLFVGSYEAIGWTRKSRAKI